MPEDLLISLKGKTISYRAGLNGIIPPIFKELVNGE
jgi:hypothetical protein